MRIRNRVLGFTAILIAASFSCNLQGLTGENIIGDSVESPPTATTIPTTAPPVVPTEDLAMFGPTPEARTIDPGTPLLDDFSERSSGWSVQYSEYWILDYFQDGYRISINASDKAAWSNLGFEHANVRIMVDARKIGGGDDNFFGVICRYQDTENFYSAVINSKGEFGILARVNGSGLELISGDQFTHSVVINPQMSLNLMEVACIGSQISLTVNGVLLAEVTEDRLLTGDVGLIVGTYSANSSDVLFDNFTLYLEE